MLAADLVRTGAVQPGTERVRPCDAERCLLKEFMQQGRREHMTMGADSGTPAGDGRYEKFEGCLC